MIKILNKEPGFTLLEMFIIFVIIGIIAAVAIPIYTTNVFILKELEAEAMLRSIRTSLRIYEAMYETYPVSEEFVNVFSLNGIDLNGEELTGRYYKPSDFFYQSLNGKSFVIKAEAKNLPVFSINTPGFFVDSVLVCR